MTAKHTPGPWWVETEADAGEDEPTLYVCHSGTVCEVTTICNFGPSHWATIDTREANARLIAAAPDLLDALRMQTRNCPMCKGTAKSVDAYTWLSSRGKEEPEPTDCRWCRDGRTAIAKATGAA